MKFKGDITGVDIQSKYFPICQRRGIYQTLIEADLRTLNTEILTGFGCVTSFFVLEHLRKDDGLNLIEKMKILGKNVLVVVPKGFRIQESPDGNPFQEHLSAWSEEDLLKAGFKVTEAWALTIKKVVPYKILFGVYEGA